MTIYFGENLKRLRKDKNMTQEALAELLGISFQAVSKWERGDTYPDITMLPVIASFFDVTTDDLLGVDKLKREEKIKEYLTFYEKMRFKDTPLTFSKFSEAVKEFPGEYRLLVRYMELLIAEKTEKDAPDYEKISQEVIAIYENIQNHCTDDSIRMWSKKLVCQHLRTKSYYTGNKLYQERAEAILNEMPEMINTREYLSTMLIDEGEKHYSACSNAIEQLIYMLQNVVNHYCYYDESFSHQYRIEAINKMLKILDIIYTDGNYGKLWVHVIYNYGHLGNAYFALSDRENALKYLKLSAEYAKKFDSLPMETERTAQFFEVRKYTKTLRGKTMCERMKMLMTERYTLSEEFKALPEFKEVIEYLS